jgi:hypothetical protein
VMTMVMMMVEMVVVEMVAAETVEEGLLFQSPALAI